MCSDICQSGRAPLTAKDVMRNNKPTVTAKITMSAPSTAGSGAHAIYRNAQNGPAPLRPGI